MSIRIIKAGVFDTIQDQGRTGFAKWGINPGGVMDAYAADVANALAGNEAYHAVLEMHFPAAEIVFLKEAMISIAGGDFSPTIDDVPIPAWKTIIVPSQSVLSFKRRQKGARVYLAIRGGFGVEQWLGSRSTNVKSGIGGFKGRRLLKDDEIVVNRDHGHSPKKLLHVFPWSVNTQSAYNHQTVGLLKGNEFDWLTDSSKIALTESEFTVHSSSDRMATHVVHEPFRFDKRSELFSSAVSFGTMQLLPSGKLIVLMADHQTTGGYPRIGHVASAFLPLFSQISPGEKFRLKVLTSAEAEKMLFSLRTEVGNIRNIVRQNLQNRYA